MKSKPIVKVITKKTPIVVMPKAPIKVTKK